MKKYMTTVMAIVLASMAGIAADKYSVNREDLPQAAQEFLTEHFPKAKVGMVKVDKHLLKKTDYDVKLVNGTKIEFNNAGKWTLVDCKNSPVPKSIVPKAIQNYVSKNFKDVSIVKIEKKATKFEVELSDDVELVFDRLGQFKSMKLDD